LILKVIFEELSDGYSIIYHDISPMLKSNLHDVDEMSEILFFKI